MPTASPTTAGRLILCEAAPNVRSDARRARFAGNPKIAVRKPEDIAAMPSQSLDLIVMHSVCAIPERARARRRCSHCSAGCSKPAAARAGRRHPAPGVRARRRARAAALRRQEGFFWAAMGGLIRTYFSGYWQLRKSLGSRATARTRDGRKARGCRLLGVSAPGTNIGHNARRMTFLAHAR